MYIQEINNNLVAWGAYPFDGYTKEIETVDYEDFDKNIGKYFYKDGEIVLNPNYEAEKELKEKERIAKLNMTKLDFAKFIENYGVTYSQLKELLATNENAQMQWDLCERVYRFNPLLDSLAVSFGITSEDLDTMFKMANGEVV